MTSVAEVATDAPSRYLKQLCRHFGHRREVEFDDARGAIPFDFGRCELEAHDATLVLRATAANDDDLAQVEQVVGGHLERFGFRDELVVVWGERTPA